MQNDLPLIIDDTKRARRNDDLVKILYNVALGRSRGRGSLDGMRATDTFRTVLITTGESPITSFSQDGGTRARTIELWGSPFGRADAGMAGTVNGINNGIGAHFSHAGPRFVRFLLGNQQLRPQWRENYQQCCRYYQTRAGNNGVACRLAAYLATLTIAAELAHYAEILPWPRQDVVQELWAEVTVETAEADRAAAALRHVVSWAHADISSFWPECSSRGSAPIEWAGRWDVVQNSAWPFLGFLPHKLNEILQSHGFAAEATLRMWADRRWLLTLRGMEP